MSSKDRSNRNPEIYISRLPSSIYERELEDKFSKYGEIRRIQLKNLYAFIEYADYKDAQYAVKRMDGRSWEGHRIVVQPRIGRSRGRSRDRDERGDRERDRNIDSRYSKEHRGKSEEDDRRRGPQKDDKCFSCGERGHWANQCQSSRSRSR